MFWNAISVQLQLQLPTGTGFGKNEIEWNDILAVLKMNNMARAYSTVVDLVTMGTVFEVFQLFDYHILINQLICVPGKFSYSLMVDWIDDMNLI